MGDFFCTHRLWFQNPEFSWRKKPKRKKENEHTLSLRRCARTGSDDMIDIENQSA
jgi:hypothetical protein